MNVQQCMQLPKLEIPHKAQARNAQSNSAQSNSARSNSAQPLAHKTNNHKQSNICSFTDDSIFTEAASHLLEILPITGLWMTQKPSKTGLCDQSYFAKQPNYFSAEAIKYLASECWLKGVTGTEEKIYLEWKGQRTDLAQPYLFTYHSAGLQPPLEVSNLTSSLSAYWLVWTRAPLTQVHKYCIEQKMQYLCMRQQNQQVHTQLHQQVRSLQKTLSRTEHQLRTPLSLVEICADILQKNISTQALKTQAQFICKTVDEINRSLKHLTCWDETTQPQKSRCDLKQLLLETIDSLQIPLAQKKITIASDTRSLLLTLDKWKIKQVFSNLLNNAISFSPSEGTISCHWQIFQSEVLIEICDQGPGFSPEDLAHLFTPLYSRRRNGTGLGMVIAKDIVLAHQGRLWAANQPTGGAIITISLPRL